MRWLYGCDKGLLAAEVVKLRISRQLDGITAVGTAVGLYLKGQQSTSPVPWGSAQRRYRRSGRQRCSYRYTALCTAL